jgi:hypothetical protein
MIPKLLWRCPLCLTHDALHQKIGWFKEDQLECSHCQAHWTVRRVKGDDYYLTLDSPGRSPSSEPFVKEEEIPLSAWYGRMKVNFKPQPLSERSPFLKEEESLYLKGKSVKLYTQEDNPDFFHKVKKSEEVKKLVYPFMCKVGKGELLLTDQRLVWSKVDKTYSFWFSDLDSVYIEASHNLGLASGIRIYKFKLKLNDSYLKWLTHVAHLAPHTAEHTISFSNY